MEPDLHSGQYLLVNKAVYLRIPQSFLRWLSPIIGKREGDLYLFHPPRYGEVAVFKFPINPTKDYIKRVIATPGDVVEIQRGKVFINGEQLWEPYIKEPADYSLSSRVVPPGHYFVLGDNRNSSSDSHVWGMVPQENIIGRAWLSYWPAPRVGLVRSFSPSSGA